VTFYLVKGGIKVLEKINIMDIVKTAIKAGENILEVYHSDQFEIEEKSDESPLTLADRKSHDTIVKELNSLYPQIPILSEEGKHLPYEERKSWEYLWLVDPLDGTKEFIKRNGEFTVNIALVYKGSPILGVIYAPVLDIVYFAKEGLGSFKLENSKSIIKELSEETELTTHSTKLPIEQKREHTTVIASRSHMSKETEEYIESLKEEVGEVEITSIGSSLKLCLVAEGTADVYPRFAPTMEWDTAAGQAIVEQAGGKVYKIEKNKDSIFPLVYNKENLLNPWFIVKK